MQATNVLPSPRIGSLFDPDGNRSAVHPELAPAALVRHDRVAHVLREIDEVCVRSPNVHPFGAIWSVAHENCHGFRVLLVAQADSSNPVPVVEVVLESADVLDDDSPQGSRYPCEASGPPSATRGMRRSSHL